MKMLDNEGRIEVLRFISSQQNPDGGFCDRGGKSDLYYSLFGGMILKGSPLNPPKGDLWNGSDALFRLRQFTVSQSISKTSGFIEQCCLALLQKELRVGSFLKLKTFVQLSRSFWKERYSINLSYRSFVLFLTLDAILPYRGILKLAVKKIFNQTVVDVNSPCSEVAASVFLQKMMNQEGKAEKELLSSFACESGGFKAFMQLPHSDMLSTAVALYALHYSGSDLRLLKPACLDFIQSNFSDGAFLSGDGDQTADVGYTFYGLLATGVLLS